MYTSTVAIVKAAVEGNSIDAHFGSLIGFNFHKREAYTQGMITREEQPTDLAFKLYLALELNLYSGRFAGWDRPEINGIPLSDEDLNLLIDELDYSTV